MDYGTIIFLSGLTSTGKTSMINELINRRNRRFFVLGFDLAEEIIPVWYSDNSKYYSLAILAMYESAKSLSEEGQDVIIDGLIMNIEGLEEHYKTLKKVFKGYPLRIIDVHCDMDILRRRNLIRGDRGEFQSLNQSKCTDKNIEYFGSIDSGENNIERCADILEKMMESVD